MTAGKCPARLDRDQGLEESGRPQQPEYHSERQSDSRSEWQSERRNVGRNVGRVVGRMVGRTVGRIAGREAGGALGRVLRGRRIVLADGDSEHSRDGSSACSPCRESPL